MDAQPDPLEKLRATFSEQRRAVANQIFPTLEERRDRLARLSQALYEAREAFVAALDSDFGSRARQETLLADLWPALRACRHYHRNVARWMRPRRRPVGLLLQQGHAWIRAQPLGVIGIVAPWNFPLLLSMAPAAAALAAGNRVMFKPSESAPRCSRLLAEVLAGAFSADEIAVVEGDATVGKAFVELPFDHLLFTGSTAVGRKVMRSASDNLTPVTLELGGKSPALVAPDADLERAAASIAFGKLLNAGQACIAPDYALVPVDHEARFVDAFKRAARRLYPTWVGNADYTAIVDDAHCARLTNLLDDAGRRGADVVTLHESGEQTVDDKRRMAPALVLNPEPSSTILQEEIFGPILPVIGYESLAEAISYIKARSHPLALYVFSRDPTSIRSVIDQTISGGVGVNDTMVHIVADDLPFGGVGTSGMGHYHGREGFDTFSKLKPVFVRGRLNLTRTLDPPYGRFTDIMTALLLRAARLKTRTRGKS